jgi:esterase/lipase superfamily enzyme
VDIPEIAKIIVEKALRYANPSSPLIEQPFDQAELNDIVKLEDRERFVDRLGSEAIMMDLVLDEPELTRFLRLSQHRMLVSAFVGKLVAFLHSRDVASEGPGSVGFGSDLGDSEASSSEESQEQQSGDAERMLEEQEMMRAEEQEVRQEAQAETMREAEEQARQEEEQIRRMEEASQQESQSYDGERNRKWIEAITAEKDAAPPAPPRTPEPPPPAALVPPPLPVPTDPPWKSIPHKLDRVRLKRPGVDGREYDATIVNVFYATDRRRASAPEVAIEYDWQQSPTGKLEYGECEVSIPDTHVMGGMESPSLLRFEFRPDPQKHIVLWKTTSIEEEAFYEKVRASVAQSEMKDAFVFIHGYNVSFEDAARRTGQFAYDLKFVGAPIFYSWPSNGSFADYIKDENNIIWSTPHFETFLDSLSQRIGAERIHIIAHSMGNRAVCEALRALSYDPNLQLKLTHLVLAAPDIDAGTFSELAATLQKHSARVTLYESSNDKALMASKKLHGNPRAGEPLLVMAGMDTIDASAVDTDFLGHSYWCEEWVVMSDIHSMLDTDQPAARRFGLTPKENAAGEYFEFQRAKS